MSNARFRPVRTILIGVGGRGKWAVDFMFEDPRFEIAALVDPDPAARQAACFKANLSEAHAYADAEEAIVKESADVVLISSPTVTHSPICRLAFQAGRHVLVEKAMTHSLQEAKDLVNAAAAAGSKFCVFQNFRYNPEFIAMRSILDDVDNEAYPGNIRIVDLAHHRYRPDPMTHTFPFAIVWDFATHHFDLLISMLGPVESVSAEAFRAPWSKYSHDANIQARVHFKNGAFCNYFLTHDAVFRDMRLTLQGDQGTLNYVGFSAMMKKTLTSHAAGSTLDHAKDVPMTSEKSSSHVVMDIFHNYIMGGAEPEISGRNNIETLLACEMLCRSASIGRAVIRTEF